MAVQKRLEPSKVSLFGSISVYYWLQRIVGVFAILYEVGSVLVTRDSARLQGRLREGLDPCRLDGPEVRPLRSAEVERRTRRSQDARVATHIEARAGEVIWQVGACIG